MLSNIKRTSGEAYDIVVENGTIADIAQAGRGTGDRLIDCSGLYASSGWIDLHVHAFPAFDPYGDEVDEIGVKTGVTTIVDAGSCGADRIGELADSGRSARTNLLALLNVSRIGLSRIDELSSMEWVDADRAAEAVRRYPAFIVGLKARMSRSVVGDSGIKPLKVALALGDVTGLPLMMHIGSGPPSITDIVPMLREGDVITHYLNGKANNLFDEAVRPLPVLTDAVRRGVRLDVGHGTASFSFKVAEAARRYGIAPDTISTDIYRGNRLNGPVYNLSNVLTKFLALGYSLEEVISAVTDRAAAWLRKPALGRIRVGEPANITLFAVEEADSPIRLVDSEGDERFAHRSIQARGVVTNGEYLTCEVRT